MVCHHLVTLSSIAVQCRGVIVAVQPCHLEAMVKVKLHRLQQAYRQQVVHPIGNYLQKGEAVIQQVVRNHHLQPCHLEAMVNTRLHRLKQACRQQVVHSIRNYFRKRVIIIILTRIRNHHHRHHLQPCHLEAMVNIRLHR